MCYDYCLNNVMFSVVALHGCNVISCISVRVGSNKNKKG